MPTMATRSRFVEDATLRLTAPEEALTPMKATLSNTGAPGQEKAGVSVTVWVGVTVKVGV